MQQNTAALALLHMFRQYINAYEAGADPGIKQRAGRMASAEREPITGVWGQNPQRSPGAVMGEAP